MKPDRLRIIYAIIYFAAAPVNCYLGITNPNVITGLSDYAFFPFITRIIETAPTILFSLSLLGFAVYQITVGTLLLSRSWFRLGIAGGIVFHLAVLPFGFFNLPNLLIALPLILRLSHELKGKGIVGFWRI